ncbi:MAG: hypothetical protein R3B13_04365 [Polyangiaceae bacterium]
MTGRERHRPQRHGDTASSGVALFARRGVASLAMAGAVFTSCVVSDPPQYESPAQTPPLLVLLDALPLVNSVIRVNSGTRVDINVPVRSEDRAGDELIARLYVDYDLDTEAVQAPLVFLPPGTYDQERNVQMTWQVPPLQPGCRQLMLVVTHRSNLSDSSRPLSNQDTAVAVWWLNINDDNDENLVSGCPSQLISP